MKNKEEIIEEVFKEADFSLASTLHSALWYDWIKDNAEHMNTDWFNGREFAEQFEELGEKIIEMEKKLTLQEQNFQLKIKECEKKLKKEYVLIPKYYAKNILILLNNMVSQGFSIVSQEIKDIVSEEAYDKLVEIHFKYHNANCGPFNRYLENTIKENQEISKTFKEVFGELNKEEKE